MSKLLELSPFQKRLPEVFLEEINQLTLAHWHGCPLYQKIFPEWKNANSHEEIPFLHVGLYKRLNFITQRADLVYQRTLLSSSTSGSQPSRIHLDSQSSLLQSHSSLKILTELVGDTKRPLLILDDVQSLRRKDDLSARTAAALSLKPLASQIHFMLKDVNDPSSMQWTRLLEILDKNDSILVYGFTWILWQAWIKGAIPKDVADALINKTIHFVHSGGWKKLEALKIDRTTFDQSLLNTLSPNSKVLDYYGLVEQVGIIFPLCEAGRRHAPLWSSVLIRNPWTSLPVPVGEIGMLQFMNVLALGAPYHSVLTEDLGRLFPEDSCPCSRLGISFEFLGRIPKAEIRGCANA